MTYNANHKTRIKDLKFLAEDAKEGLDKLDARTEILTYNNSGTRNSLARGINLGAFTAEHLAAIKAGTFEGMCLGDWFIVNGRKCYIAGFNYITGYTSDAPKNSITLLGELPNQPLTNSDAPNAFYGESYWYTECRPTYIAEYEEAFGAKNISTFKVFSPIGYRSYTADGATYYEPNAFVGLSSKVHLPTYSMCVGHAISPYHHFRPYFEWNYSYPNYYYYPQLPIYRAGLGRKYSLFSVLSDVEANTYHICVRSPYSVMHEPKTYTQQKFAVFHVQA